MHIVLEYNIPALAPSVRIRSATSGQPSPPVGRSVNQAQHIITSPAASLMGAVGGINEIVASVSNSNQIWKRYIILASKVLYMCTIITCIAMAANWKHLAYTQPCSAYSILFQYSFKQDCS